MKKSKNFEEFIKWFNCLPKGSIITKMIIRRSFRSTTKPKEHSIYAWLKGLRTINCIKISGKKIFDTTEITKKKNFKKSLSLNFWKSTNISKKKSLKSMKKSGEYKTSTNMIEIPKEHYEKLTKTVIDLTKITKNQQDEIKKLKETVVDPSWLDSVLDELRRDTGLQI